MHPDYAIGWFKTYFNGTTIDGTDAAIKGGHISWRATPEDGIKEVRVVDFIPADKFGFKVLAIAIADKNQSKASKYWQSDEMTIGALVNGQAKRTKRRIMRLITPQDTHLVAKKTSESIELEFNGSVKDGPINLVQPSWFNKWLVLEIDRETKTLNMYFSDNII